MNSLGSGMAQEFRKRRLLYYNELNLMHKNLSLLSKCLHKKLLKSKPKTRKKYAKPVHISKRATRQSNRCRLKCAGKHP
jgi:hypothetical protein